MENFSIPIYHYLLIYFKKCFVDRCKHPCSVNHGTCFGCVNTDAPVECDTKAGLGPVRFHFLSFYLQKKLKSKIN